MGIPVRAHSVLATEYVSAVQELAEWKRLPKAALRALDATRDEVAR